MNFSQFNPQQYAGNMNQYVSPVQNNQQMQQVQQLQRLQQLEQQNPHLVNQQMQGMFPQQQMQPQTPSVLKGRQVSGVEEARASQVDFDGSVNYYIDIANGKIYTKQLGVDGRAIFTTYGIEAPPAPEPSAGELVKTLEDRIQTLEQTVSTLKGATDEHTANNGNATGERKSATNVKSGNGKQSTVSASNENGE